MHKVADQVEVAVSVPAGAPGRRHRRGRYDGPGLTTVGLLGTAFTMEQDFYRRPARRARARVLVPPPDDRAEVHRIIYDELCLGNVTRSHGRCTATSSADSHMPVPRALSWAARRSSCLSAPRTAPCRCSRPPGCMSRRPSPFPLAPWVEGRRGSSALLAKSLWPSLSLISTWPARRPTYWDLLRVLRAPAHALLAFYAENRKGNARSPGARLAGP